MPINVNNISSSNPYQKAQTLQSPEKSIVPENTAKSVDTFETPAPIQAQAQGNQSTNTEAAFTAYEENDSFIDEVQELPENDGSVSKANNPYQITKTDSSRNYAAEALKQALGSLLGRIAMLQGELYTARSWSKLMKAYGSSMAVYLKDVPDELDLDRAFRNLMGDFIGLRDAEKDENPIREKLPVVLKEDTSDAQAVAVAVATAGSSSPGLASPGTVSGGLSVSVDISV